jgi:hypothetical protein
MTGAMLHVNRDAIDLDLELPSTPSKEDVAGDLENERRKVANHAYGFVSRGNCEGGFAHVRQWIAAEADPNEAIDWFFTEMMRWEKKDAALFFAQECLAHYLHHDQEVRALKLMSRCLYEEPRWKPRLENRQHAVELAERCGRDDLLRLLRG